MDSIFRCLTYCFVLILFYSVALAQSSSDASATGISRAFNPAMSVNCLFDGMYTDQKKPVWDEIGLQPGLHYQEISIEMTSNVDVYLQSKVVTSAAEESGLAIEEAYISTLRMPIPVTIRGGKMFNTFGRHNLYHLHHMPFAEVPLIHQQVFGPDLRDVSIEASYLLPLDWYTDFTVGILNGDNNYLFHSDKQNAFAYLMHMDNLYDVTDEITLRVGGSYLLGERGLHHSDEFFSMVGSDTTEIFSHIWGADFHLKWRPLQYGRYRSFTLQAEYISARLKLNNNYSDHLHGFFIQGLGQIHLRWWLQARYGWFHRPDELHNFFPEPESLNYNNHTALEGDRISLSIAYVPTEFAAYRLQYNLFELNGSKEQQIVAQVNITIGSHPAHKY